jgi:two-component system, OmpR family, sensor histidine kinase CpxA
MRSLFLRILLWFGLTMIAAAVGSFVVGVIAEREARDFAPPHLVQALGVYSQTAADMIERDGPSAVDAYFDRIEKLSGIHAFLIDEHGSEVSGESLPAGTIELVQRARQKEGLVNDLTRNVPLNAVAARSPSGAVYVLVAEDPAFRRGRFGIPGPGFRFSLLAITRYLLPVLLVGGVFCYWLARYLSTPMEELRGVAQELSEGNLSVRVKGRLLRRRDEIGHLVRDFNLMAERIESLVEAQRRLLGDISHELRSPLARQGVALGLARRKAGPDAGGALDRIERESERLNEMIGQLLTLTRLESGTHGLDNVKIDLGALLHDVADDADFEAHDRNRSVKVVKDEPTSINGAPGMIHSAIENVVRNAVRHTAEGSPVEVSLSSESRNGDRVALISVRDHGKGVPDEAIEEIFRPFYRVEPDRDRKTGGVGLGLSIAARAVRLHHGTIKAFNAADGGLVVEIRLPSGKSADCADFD